jgi:replicative DNA helicase
MHNDHHSIEAEHSVLGSLLIRPDVLDELEGLKASDFWVAEHAVLFETISLMVMANEAVDVVTVNSKLQETGRAQEVGGLSFLGELYAKTPSTANAKRYAKIVSDHAKTRALIAAGAEVQKIADSADPIEQRIAKAQELVLGMDAEHSNGNEPLSIQQVAITCLQDVDRRMKGEATQGLLTGYYELDAMTGGLQNGDLVIIAGRPSMGKTCIALNIAQHIATHKHVHFVSLEMSSRQLGNRSLASLGGVELNQILYGSEYTGEQLELLDDAVGMLHRLKMTIDEHSNTAEMIAATARKLKRKHDLGAVFVDYLGLVQGKGDNKNAEITKISASMKTLAKQLQVPVVVLCQLNRGVEQRPDKRPLMSDLRDSGSIEQDADMILMPYRDEYYYQDNPQNKGWAELLIRKQRMGPVGSVLLQFQGKYSRFVNPAKSELHLYQPGPGRSAGGNAKPYYSGGLE